MSSTIQVGAILLDDWPLTLQVLGLNSEPYFGTWGVIKALDGFALDRKIHAAGWNFFFMATEVKAIFFGALGPNKIHVALKRILAKVRGQDFNCLEVTGIVARRFLGVRYSIVSAHSRHIQQSCRLDDIDGRRTSRRDAERAKGQ